MEPETWRWLIGGGLGALTFGVGWLLRMAWQASAVLARIEARLGHHGETLADHATRLHDVESATARHSGRWEASA